MGWDGMSQPCAAIVPGSQLGVRPPSGVHNAGEPGRCRGRWWHRRAGAAVPGRARAPGRVWPFHGQCWFPSQAQALPKPLVPGFLMLFFFLKQPENEDFVPGGFPAVSTPAGSSLTEVPSRCGSSAGLGDRGLSSKNCQEMASCHGNRITGGGGTRCAPPPTRGVLRRARPPPIGCPGPWPRPLATVPPLGDDPAPRGPSGGGAAGAAAGGRGWGGVTAAGTDQWGQPGVCRGQ